MNYNNIQFTQTIDGKAYCEIQGPAFPVYEIITNGKYTRTFLNQNKYRVIGFIEDGMVIRDKSLNRILVPTSFILINIKIYGDVASYLDIYESFVRDKIDKEIE